MKNIILTLVIILVSGFSLLAQNVPLGMKYQAVARDAKGVVMGEKEISLRIRLLADQPEGKSMYTEIHRITTSQLGLFDLTIGQGENVLGTFDKVPWSKREIWMELSIDDNGGDDFSVVTTNKLLAVPYAFHAGTADELTGEQSLEKRRRVSGLPFWSLGGNKNTDDTQDWIGTENEQDVVLKTNNEERLRVESTGKSIFSDSVLVNDNLNAASFTLPNGAINGHVLVSDADGNGTWQPIGAIPGGDVQLITKEGNVVTLSQGGGSFVDEVDDADNDPSNEFNSNLVFDGTTIEVTDAGGTQTADLSSLEESAEVAAAQATADGAVIDASNAQSSADAAQSTANTAVNAAVAAQATADGAVIDASNAQSAADAAQSTANTAVNAAVAAQATADGAVIDASNAQSAADAAQSTANTAVNAAAAAQTTADGAVIDASNAQSSADAAQSTANTAVNAAAAAQATADGAVNAASNAQSSADAAQSTANTAVNAAAAAQTTADGAVIDASNAQSAADAAQSTANTAVNAAAAAQTTADGAVIDASNAQSSADAAQSTANTAVNAAAAAQTTADGAVIDASNAQSAADAAQSTANTAVNAAAAAQTTADGAVIDASNAQSAADAAQSTANGALGLAQVNETSIASHVSADGDLDPVNELQTLVLSGTQVELSQGGGTVDLVTLKQTLTRSGNDISLSNGGGSVSVDDDDSNPTNELQSIGREGNNIVLSNAGGIVSVEDDDSNPTNELNETVEFDGAELVIVDGGGAKVVDLSSLEESAEVDFAVSLADQARARAILADNRAEDARNRIDAHTAADNDTNNSNEIQGLSRSGSNISLSRGGGTVSIDDADNNTSNEIQSLSKSGSNITLSRGGGTVNVNDADSNTSNEIQTLSKSGNTVSLSRGGGSISVADNDNSASNEIQSISRSGSTVSLSRGGGSFKTFWRETSRGGIISDGIQNVSLGIAENPFDEVQLYIKVPNGNFNAGNFVNNSPPVGSNNTSAPTLILENLGGGQALSIFSGTASKPGGGDWNTTSDARLKKDIEDYQFGLETLLSVRPVKYHYNGKTGLPTEPEYVGVIAQELQAIAPDMVMEYTAKDGNNYLMVDPSAFTYMLINAVQQQQEQIEQLQEQIQRNQQLEDKMRLLEERLQKLEK